MENNSKNTDYKDMSFCSSFNFQRSLNLDYEFSKFLSANKVISELFNTFSDTNNIINNKETENTQNYSIYNDNNPNKNRYNGNKNIDYKNSRDCKTLLKTKDINSLIWFLKVIDEERKVSKYFY